MIDQKRINKRGVKRKEEKEEKVQDWSQKEDGEVTEGGEVGEVQRWGGKEVQGLATNVQN